MKKTKKATLLGVFASLILLTAACSAPADVLSEKKTEPSTEQGDSTQKEGEKAKEEKLVQVKESDLNNVKADIETKAEYITTLEKELKYYKEYTVSMTNLMTDEERQKIIEKEWDYTLTVNGIGFPTNGILQVSASDFEVVLTEEKAPYSVLSEEDQAAGKLKGDVQKAISSKMGETKIVEEEHKQQVVIEFTDAQPGDEIALKINQALQEKLGFESTELIIRVN